MPPAPNHCSCLENPMDRGAWRAMVRGVLESQTRLKRLSTPKLNISIPVLELVLLRCLYVT